MKKTIAKIMAAAMVLSTVVAPEALAATKGSFTTFANANYDTLYITDSSKEAEDVTGDYELDYIVSAEEAADLVAMAGTTTGTYTASDNKWNVTSASVWVTKATADVAAEGANLTPSLTDVTAGSAVKTVEVTNPSDIEDYLTIGAQATGKVVTNGEYNDTINDGSRTRWAVPTVLNNGGIGVNFVRTTANATVFDNFIYKLNQGAIVRVPIRINGVNGIMRVWFANTVVGDGDIYWNGIVKLKSSNNRYTPIRVHYDVVANSVAGANAGAFVEIVNGTITRVNGIATNAIRVNGLANQRLELQDVNEYDMEMLKSDIAKGKNLMLDEVFVFSVANFANDNGLYSAYTQDVDWSTLAVNTDLSTVSVGKIDTINSQLFKNAKEKFVKAEYAKFIHNGAFRKNKQLKKAYIGTEKNLKKVNAKAFYDCKKLATVKLSGKGLKQVGSKAFSGCKSNMIFKIKGNSTQVKKAWAKIKKQAPAKAKYAKI